MKTYKTWEAIKMLTENPKLKLESSTGSEITVVNNFCEIQDVKNIGNLRIYTDEEWHLVQQPVAFMEAANSGRRIKHESWEYYHNLSIVIDKINNRSQERQLELLNGKWYVEEEE